MKNSKKYFLLPLTLVIFSAVGLYSYSYTKKTMSPQQPISINEVSTSGTVTLEASPPANLYLGNRITLDINAKFEPNLTHLTAVTLDLAYPSSGVALENFVSTSYLPVVLSKAVYGGGKLNVTLGVTPSLGGQASWGTVGRLTFKALTPGTYTVNFTNDTLATATESSVNVLKTVTPFNINVFYPGDANQDKKVDLLDYNALVITYGRTEPSLTDFNQSGKVDLYDYNLLVSNYGKVSN